MATFGWPEFLFILRAAGWTLLLTALSFAIGGLMGGLLAIMRLSANRWAAGFAAGYILVIQSISNGLSLINLGTPARYMITGGVLLLAVIVDSLSRRSRASHGRA